MTRWIRDFWANERGATAVEYALVAGIVSISIVVGLTQIGPQLIGKFQSVSDGFNN